MSDQDSANQGTDKKLITYEVNGEKETTKKKKLTVREILENAGFTPATDYTLKSKDPKEDFDSHYDKEVEINEGQKFHALFKKVTPTS